MDGLSAAASLITVLQTAWQTIDYIKAVRGGGEARRKLLLELIRATGLLATLSELTEDVRTEEWSQALQSLDGPNGPLRDFRVLLEEMVDEMGIKPVPQQAPQIQQSVSVVSKSRRLIRMSGIQGGFNPSSSTALLRREEAFESPQVT